jgi:MFS family permease
LRPRADVAHWQWYAEHKHAAITVKRTGHKGRLISLGCVVFVIGSICCTLPQFLGAPYSASELDLDSRLCLPPATNITGSTASAAAMWPVILLMLGQVLHGLGSAPLHTLSLPYIDENVEQKEFSIYLG